MSEAEFWESRRFLIENEMWRSEQRKGVPSYSISDLKTTAIDNETADMKLTLTPVQITQIFKEHPSVKRAYEDNVPMKMNEQKFWGNFVVSKYFHRSRGSINVGNDFFAKYELPEGTRVFFNYDRNRSWSV